MSERAAPASLLPMKRAKKIVGIVAWTLGSMIAGALFDGVFGSQIWPRLQILADRISGDTPKPSISIAGWELVQNPEPIDYTDRCEEFGKFLDRSSLWKLLPSAQYIAHTVTETGKPPTCSVFAPFPNFMQEHLQMFVMYPSSTEWPGGDDCSDCKQLRIAIGNNGPNPVEYVRARIHLSNKWEIRKIDGTFIENRGSNTLVIYRDQIAGRDVVGSTIWVRSKSKEWGRSSEFVDKLEAAYGWHGREMPLGRTSIGSTFGILIENCRVNCRNSAVEDFSQKEWDGFPEPQ